MATNFGPTIPKAFVDSHTKAANSSGVSEGLTTGKELANQYRSLTKEQKNALPGNTFDLGTIGFWSQFGSGAAAQSHTIRQIGR